MDISNATAAGPSYGLLDVLFGTKPEEADEAGGKEFMPLMNLIKALNNRGQEETGGRTDEETAAGKGAIDYRSVGMPGWFPMQMSAQPDGGAAAMDAEGTAAGRNSSVPVPEGAVAAKPTALSGELDPSQVNQLLKEKSLAPLTAEEAKLLRQVNVKMVEAAGRQQSPSVGEAGLMAAPETERARAGAQQSELEHAAAGLVRGKGQQGPEAMAAPEKFLSTEAYLQMHDRFGKGKQKAESPQPTGQEGEINLPWLEASGAQAREAVTGAEQKGRDLFGRTERDAADIGRPGETDKMPGAGALAFRTDLAQALKGSGEAGVRDIMLPGVKPEEMRNALLGEVNQSVSYHALKGGGEMRLVIHPEELGEVKLKIGTSQGKVEVQITAENEEVARTIRSGSKELESSLREQNLALAKFDVTVADGPVASAETKGNLTDQFLQQNSQQGFTQQGSGSESGFSRWDGSQNYRQEPGSGLMAEENGSGNATRQSQTQKTPVRDSSRRLDVVA